MGMYQLIEAMKEYSQGSAMENHSIKIVAHGNKEVLYDGALKDCSPIDFCGWFLFSYNPDYAQNNGATPDYNLPIIIEAI